MDANSLFLTANADTVYYLAALDLTQRPDGGRAAVERRRHHQRHVVLAGSSTSAAPAPIAALGGKYLIVRPGYDGPLPEGGYFVAHSKTNLVLYAARAYLVDNDPKPAVENIKKNLKIYPYTAGRLRHEHRPGARRQRCASQASRRSPRRSSSRRSGKVVQHHPAERLRLLRDDQRERPERAGHQLRRRARRAACRHRHRARARRSRPTSG